MKFNTQEFYQKCLDALTTEQKKNLLFLSMYWGKFANVVMHPDDFAVITGNPHEARRYGYDEGFEHEAELKFKMSDAITEEGAKDVNGQALEFDAEKEFRIGFAISAQPQHERGNVEILVRTHRMVNAIYTLPKDFVEVYVTQHQPAEPTTITSDESDSNITK